MTGTPVILDTDTGVDDAMAVVYGLLMENLDVLALTTVFGNVGLEATTRNTLAIAEQIGVEPPPVSRGAAQALIEPSSSYEFVHGDDGVGNADFPVPRAQVTGEPAAQTIIRLAHAHAGELVLVAIGPLTNLALALRLDETLPALIKRVVWMGGVVTTPGNVTPVAEADAALDPEAAWIVLDADWPITMVGLDVTDRTIFEADDYERVRSAQTPAARYVSAVAPFYMSFYEKSLGRWACPLHSPLAVGIAADPTLATDTLRCPVTVSLGAGVTRGMTVADRRPGQDTGARESMAARTIDTVLDVDIPRFKAHFLETICDARTNR